MRSATVTRAGATALALILIAACAAPAPTPAPVVATPRPTPTPDPHLVAPATADEVYLAFGRAGLRAKADNAFVGVAGDEPVKRINATYLGWPLTISQFSSSDALATALDWGDDGPGAGEPSVSVSGMNILVTWGPVVPGEAPPTLDAQRSAGLEPMVHLLDELISPLRAHAIVTVNLPDASPGPVADEIPSDAPETTP